MTRGSLNIQRLVPPENPSSLNAIRRSLARYVLMFGRAATRSRSSTGREFALERLHAFRKGVAQSLHDLEQRQVDIGQAAAGDVSPAIGRQQVLEIAEIFRHASLPEFIGAFLRRRLLVLVVQRGPSG
jgi:hypothetical protein